MQRRGISTLESECIAILASFVNFLLPPRTRGEGWGGVKNLRLLQGLLYAIFSNITTHIFAIKNVLTVRRVWYRSTTNYCVQNQIGLLDQTIAIHIG